MDLLKSNFPNPQPQPSTSSESPFTTEINGYEPWEPILKAEQMKILHFLADGNSIYKARDDSGHIWYDVCNCEACQKDAWDDEDDGPKKEADALFPEGPTKTT